jgi:ribosomal protein S18 acetylase RimI-like enzyme
VVRAAVTLRLATPDDLPVLLELWQQLRDRSPRRAGRAAGSAALEQVEQRYRSAMTDPGCRLVVAEDADQVVGMALYTLGSASSLLDVPAVEMTHVCVDDGQRRRGVGKALVGGAATYAEELGVEQVVVATLPQDREGNRFYARLGFGPVVVRRVAAVAALRRHLGQPERRTTALRRELRVPRRPVRR